MQGNLVEGLSKAYGSRGLDHFHHSMMVCSNKPWLGFLAKLCFENLRYPQTASKICVWSGHDSESLQNYSIFHPYLRKLFLDASLGCARRETLKVYPRGWSPGKCQRERERGNHPQQQKWGFSLCYKFSFGPDLASYTFRNSKFFTSSFLVWARVVNTKFKIKYRFEGSKRRISRIEEGEHLIDA